MQSINLPDELLELVTREHPSGHTPPEVVRFALAAHLFERGAVPIGRAAELSGLSRIEFEAIVVDRGGDTWRYDRDDLETDRASEVVLRDRFPSR